MPKVPTSLTTKVTPVAGDRLQGFDSEDGNALVLFTIPDTTISPFNYFYVEDPAYGAVGNGTTDDATAIGLALTAIDTAGGGTLVFGSNKTYAIGSTLTIPENIIIQGNGATLKAIDVTAGSGYLYFNSVGNITVKDLTLDVNDYGTVGNPATNGFVFAAATNFLVENCVIRLVSIIPIK